MHLGALHLKRTIALIKKTRQQVDSNNDSPSSGKLLMTLTAAVNFASRLRLSSSSSAMLGPNKDGIKEGVVTSRARKKQRNWGIQICCIVASMCQTVKCRDAHCLYWGCWIVLCWRSIRPFPTRPCPAFGLSPKKTPWGLHLPVCWFFYYAA